MAERLYVVALEFGGWTRRLFLQGCSCPVARERFLTVLRELPVVAGASGSWREYFDSATERFRAAGFVRVAH
jgi:hypothetical protein